MTPGQYKNTIQDAVHLRPSRLKRNVPEQGRRAVWDRHRQAVGAAGDRQAFFGQEDALSVQAPPAEASAEAGGAEKAAQDAPDGEWKEQALVCNQQAHKME